MLRANNRLIQRIKTAFYSITSSPRSKNASGRAGRLGGRQVDDQFELDWLLVVVFQLKQHGDPRGLSNDVATLAFALS
jgi:hypothetical protein